jgi:hypothetical protein
MRQLLSLQIELSLVIIIVVDLGFHFIRDLPLLLAVGALLVLFHLQAFLHQRLFHHLSQNISMH